MNIIARIFAWKCYFKASTREQCRKSKKQSVLKVFQEEKRISWGDFSEKEIFFDIKGNDRDIQLRNVLADLIEEGLIMPVHGIRPAWVIVE